MGLKGGGGGSRSLLKVRIKEYGLDTSHFAHPSPPNSRRRVTAEALFQYNRRKGCREDTRILRRVMLEAGVTHQCVGKKCGLPPKWKGRPLQLQVDHINGDPFDNRLTNLRFLCPNCHSQYTLEAKVLVSYADCKCGAQIKKSSSTCKKCHLKGLSNRVRSTKATWPDNDTLSRLLWEKPATQVAKELGVSSVAVKKWCKHRTISTPPRGYWQKVRSLDTR